MHSPVHPAFLNPYMMKIEMPSLVEEFNKTTNKLIKGYETLQEIKNIEVATTPKELVWKQDHVSMYRYKRETPAKVKTPLLVSFALMNRQDVLDLQPDRSLMKKLLDLGLDIYIMDWGYPTRQHRYLTMEDYILGYMNDAVDFVREAHGLDKINKMGICQGGTFSMIYAAIHPEKINSLTTMVAPFQFDIQDENDMLYQWARDIDVDTLGMMPADLLDDAFGMLKPSMDVAKYIGILEGMDDEAKLENFLRMEQWKGDTPDLPGELYRKYIKDLWQENKLIKGEFSLGDHQVNLKNVNMPVLTVYAAQDNIIPPVSTKPIMDAISSKDKEMVEFPGGHIGVFVGGKSQKELGPNVAEWISKRS